MGPAELNQVPKKAFYYFLPFGSKVFNKIEYNIEYNSLRKCLTCSRDKVQNKKFGGPNLEQNGPKSDLNFFCHFVKFSSLVFL